MTSGGYGFGVERSIAHAYLPADRGEALLCRVSAERTLALPQHRTAPQAGR